MKKLIILILLLTQPAFGNDAVLLNVGDKVPYSGYLLDPEKAKQLYNNDIDLQLSKKTVDNLNLQIVDYQKRVDNFSTQNDKLSERLQKSDSSFFEKVGFFIFGSSVTALLAYGIYRTK